MEDGQGPGAGTGLDERSVQHHNHLYERLITNNEIHYYPYFPSPSPLPVISSSHSSSVQYHGEQQYPDNHNIPLLSTTSDFHDNVLGLENDRHNEATSTTASEHSEESHPRPSTFSGGCNPGNDISISRKDDDHDDYHHHDYPTHNYSAASTQSSNKTPHTSSIDASTHHTNSRSSYTTLPTTTIIHIHPKRDSADDEPPAPTKKSKPTITAVGNGVLSERSINLRGGEGEGEENGAAKKRRKTKRGNRAGKWVQGKKKLQEGGGDVLMQGGNESMD